MLCVWANFKDVSVWLMVVAYAVGVSQIVLIYGIEYLAVAKEVRANDIPVFLMAYEYRIENIDMVAIFNIFQIKLNEVKEILKRDEYDNRIQIMTKKQYQSLEIEDEDGNTIMNFCDFINGGGK